MSKRKTLPESVTDKKKPGDKPGKNPPMPEPTVKHDVAKIKKPKGKGKLARITHPGS